VIRQKAISDRFLLGIIFLGLNVLCFLGITHGHHVVRHTRVNYSHVHLRSSRGGRSDYHSVEASVKAYLDHSIVDHVPQVTLSKATKAIHVQPGLAVVTLVMTRPDVECGPLSEENILALGSAPRAPGLGRAPPITA
jgi:hypothetical protein